MRFWKSCGILVEENVREVKKVKKTVILILILALLLSGCQWGQPSLSQKVEGGDSISQAVEKETSQGSSGRSLLGAIGELLGVGEDTVAFDQIVYTRPDMEELERILLESCDTAVNGESFMDVQDAIWNYYDAYDQFYTNYNLSYIYYCRDLTDAYWQEEYNFCADSAATVDAGLEELYYALADSSYRNTLERISFGKGFFDAYDGESVWDAEFLALMEEEAALQNEYYQLSADAMEVEYYSDEFFEDYGADMAQVFVDLVAVRQKIAEAAGYDSYPEFAYDWYYYRDYTPDEAETYALQVGNVFYDLYTMANEERLFDLGKGYCSEEDAFAYVQATAQKMGGEVEDAFQAMVEGGYYDISYGKNKSGGSFEVFLTTYNTPYLFTSPSETQYDKLVFAHEFGHFASDYSCGGAYAGIDVAEVFSQGLEYLSLCWAGDDTLETYKIADSLFTYVEQAAYAVFEHQVYDLKGDQLTVENVYALYEQICTDFGFTSWSWDSRDFVIIDHFFSQPLYVISYVVSNDVAFQLYQLEKEDPGAGAKLFEKYMDTTESYIITFAEDVGLESPFAPGRLEAVCQSMEEILN